MEKDLAFLLVLLIGPSRTLHVMQSFYSSFPCLAFSSPSLSFPYPFLFASLPSFLLSIQPSSHLSTHPSSCQSTHSCTHLSIHLLDIHPSIYPAIHSPIHSSVHPSTHTPSHPPHYKDSEPKGDPFMYDLVVNRELCNVLKKGSHFSDGQHIVEKRPRQEYIRRSQRHILSSRAWPSASIKD